MPKIKSTIEVDVSELVEEVLRHIHHGCKGKTSIAEFEKWRQLLAQSANKKYGTSFAERSIEAKPGLGQNSFYYVNPNE